jgi:hypothetical protein
MPSRRVTGYHGTSQEKAEAILNEGYHLSQNPYDWLGHGVYFFQDGPERASQFAENWEDEESNTVVLKSTIDLDGEGTCIDFLDVKWNNAMQVAYERFRSKAESALPEQDFYRRELDCTVLNHACEEVFPRRGIQISSIRAPFDEGEPIYDGSQILDLSHVQIAVRNLNIIRSIEPYS